MSSPNAYAVRVLRADDAEEVGRLHVQVWREAYAGLMPQAYLDAMDVDRSVAKWRQIIDGSGQDERDHRGDGLTKVTRVAEHRDSAALVGFATFGPAREDGAPAPGQLWAINVLATHHGSGVADQLMAATVGERPAYLWVVEGNRRAQAFYRRHGFALDGAAMAHAATGAVEVRMIRTSRPRGHTGYGDPSGLGDWAWELAPQLGGSEDV